MGGYRLARPAATIAVAQVLQAVGARLDLTTGLGPSASGSETPDAELRVLQSMGRRLQGALDRELALLTLEELLFDLSSWQESLDNEGGVMLG
jgi:DNA-binding IscR family transcriptional regulator